VPPLKGLYFDYLAYPALKRWAILCPSRYAGLDSSSAHFVALYCP
jgi:hypothetical protein